MLTPQEMAEKTVAEIDALRADAERRADAARADMKAYAAALRERRETAKIDALVGSMTQVERDALAERLAKTQTITLGPLQGSVTALPTGQRG